MRSKCLLFLPIIIKGLREELVNMDRLSPFIELLSVQVFWSNPISLLLGPWKAFCLRIWFCYWPRSYITILLFIYSTTQGRKISSTNTSTLSNHLAALMVFVDIYPSGYYLLIVYPSGSKSSIRVYYCFSSSDKIPILVLIPLGDNNYYKYWSRFPWYWNSPSTSVDSFN